MNENVSIDEMKVHKMIDHLIATGGRVVNENVKSAHYVLFIVGNDKTIVDVAIKLNALGFFGFNHNGFDPKTKINRLECEHRIIGYPIRERLKRWGCKTRLNGPPPRLNNGNETQVDLRDSNEDSSNATRESEVVGEGHSQTVESPMLAGCGAAYSIEQDVQDTKAEHTEQSNVNT